MIVKFLTKEKEYRFTDIYIEHSWFEFVRAEVHLAEPLDSSDMEKDFTITVNNQIRFRGRIAQIADAHILELVNIIENHHDLGKSMNWLIKCLKQNTIQSYGVIWSATEQNGQSIFSLSKTEYELNKIKWINMKKAISYNKPNYELNINVKYDNTEVITEDLSTQIFGPDGFAVKKPDAFLEFFKLGRTFESSSTVISKSNITSQLTDKQTYQLNGILEITRSIQTTCNEVWTHTIDQKGINTIYASINFDMSDYFKQIKPWEPNHQYYKGMPIIHTDDDDSVIMYCKRSHESGHMIDIDYWQKTEDFCEILSEDCAYNSSTGKKMHATLLNYMMLQIWMHAPIAHIDFTACSYDTNAFEAGDTIIDPVTKKKFILISYSKHYGHNVPQGEISLFKAYELPFEITEINSEPAFNEPDYSYFVQSEILKTQRSVSLILGSEKMKKTIQIRTKSYA